VVPPPLPPAEAAVVDSDQAMHRTRYREEEGEAA
jgi:hypothetical protein